MLIQGRRDETGGSKDGDVWGVTLIAGRFTPRKVNGTDPDPSPPMPDWPTFRSYIYSSGVVRFFFLFDAQNKCHKMMSHRHGSLTGLSKGVHGPQAKISLGCPRSTK